MRRRWLVVPVTMAVVAAGCSGEDLAERVAENRIESETGEDVDIDLDDGGIAIRSEDGEFSIDVDDDDGNVSISAVGEDGEFSIDVDDDDGNVSISGVGEDGEFSIESEDGETVFRSEEGETVMTAGSEIPDDFPDDVPIPDGLTVEFSQTMDTPDGITFTVLGQVSGEHADVAADYVASLESAGFDQVQLTTMPDGSFFVYQNAAHEVGGSISRDVDAATSVLSLTVNPISAG